ncbi:hypothetical protein ACFQ36_16465, partial [Arthrobacter sp. GCM10027362]|uniref:hypothetical protein n=1 Tax=Arthrobacter sp. GCM10027362 TaxID=3273379 RepID=UPI0036438C7C
MSQESQPPRSRREARMQARRAPSSGSEQRGRVAVETPQSLGAVPVPARTAAPGRTGGEAADAAAGSERASQARARDREVRQAYNALTGALPKIAPPDAAAVPTRRQLRMQQLEREHMLNTAGTGSDPSSPAGGSPAEAAPSKQADAKESSGSSAKVTDAAYQPERPALRGGRRDRRERRKPQPDAEAAGLTAEEALAAREELMDQAAGLADLIGVEPGQDPGKVDLKLLAEQKALAERAAILNRRAADKQRLSAETRQGRDSGGTPAAPRDPVSAPMEFVRLPGSDRQVMRPAATSFVPIVTDPTPAQRQAGSKPPAATQPVAKVGPAAKSGAARPQPAGTEAAQKQQPGQAAPRTQAVPAVGPAAKAAPAARTQPVDTAKPAPKTAAAPATEPVALVRPGTRTPAA